MRKQVGIFSGSFNPIHIGHLVLANYIKEFTYIDEVWFVVSPHNPLKNVNDLLDDNIRLEMTQMAVSQFLDIKVSDIEFGMPKPSFTIDTINKLSEEYSDIDFTLIIGGDNWNSFNKWKDYKILLDKYKIIIYPRLGDNIFIDSKYQNNVSLVQAPIVEVSSTFVRQSIKNNKDMRAFLPSGVYDFIIKNNLYR